MGLLVVGLKLMVRGLEIVVYRTYEGLWLVTYVFVFARWVWCLY